MNTKTAEEITEALGFLQEYAKCGIWHNYMVNDEGREIKLKTMYDSIDLVKKRIEELEALLPKLKMTNPDKNNGWIFDYSLCKDICYGMRNNENLNTSMEEVHEVLMQLFKLGLIINPSTNGKQD